jgi:DnaJ domain
MVQSEGRAHALRWRPCQTCPTFHMQAITCASDAHSLLGVPPGAPKDVIKRAYRKLVLRTHPDIAHDGGSEERFIQVPYTLLSSCIPYVWYVCLQCMQCACTAGHQADTCTCDPSLGGAISTRRTAFLRYRSRRRMKHSSSGGGSPGKRSRRARIPGTFMIGASKLDARLPPAHAIHLSRAALQAHF